MTLSNHKKGCSVVSLCRALLPHMQEASYKRAVLCIDRIIALLGVAYAVESHTLVHMSGVEYIIQVQQKYVITQENILK